jgi:RNA polymerase sigma-70 factor (ECF subfamily)
MWDNDFRAMQTLLRQDCHVTSEQGQRPPKQHLIAPADEVAARFTTDVTPLTDQLRRAARRYAGQHADAEDLLQETLTQAWKSYSTFEPGTNMRAWLFRIMVNTWINRYRTAQRRPSELLVADHLDEGAARRGSNVEDAVLGDVPTPELLHALQSLPESQRVLLYYAYVEGYKLKDVSAMTGLPVGTIMSRLHRARHRLRASLTEGGFAYGHGRPAIAPQISGAA